MNGLQHLVGIAPLTFAGAAAMTFGAAFVRGLTGFGMAIILVPLLGLIIPPAQAVVLGILLQLLIGPVGLGLINADADRATALPIGLIAMVTTPIGMAVLDVTRPDVARLLITVVAVGAFVAVLLPKQPEGHRPGCAAVIGTGSPRASSPASRRCRGRRSCSSICAAASIRRPRARRCC